MSSRAVPPIEIDPPLGSGFGSGEGGEVVGRSASDDENGLTPDPITAELGVLAAEFEDLQRVRKSQHLRALAAEEAGMPRVALLAAANSEMLKKREDATSRELKKALKKHVLWDWLEPKKGLAGPLTARLLAIISNPRRFPGQPCTEGHYFPPDYQVGSPCLITAKDGEGCRGTMLPPRPHSGVRSLYHYCGVHVGADGRSPGKRKGQKADWNPAARTLLLQPEGLADQIVKHKTEQYREIYDETKDRLVRERGVVTTSESAIPRGPAQSVGEAESIGDTEESRGLSPGMGAADSTSDSARSSGGSLRPFQIHGIARKVAVKRFLGDLLVEWKRRVEGADA